MAFKLLESVCQVSHTNLFDAMSVLNKLQKNLVYNVFIADERFNFWQNVYEIKW